MFSTDFIFRQQENLVDNQKCHAGFLQQNTISCGFNSANMTYPLVELGNFNPTFPYFYQLERQICKIEAAKSRAGVSNVSVAIP